MIHTQSQRPLAQSRLKVPSFRKQYWNIRSPYAGIRTISTASSAAGSFHRYVFPVSTPSRRIFRIGAYTGKRMQSYSDSLTGRGFFPDIECCRTPMTLSLYIWREFHCNHPGSLSSDQPRPNGKNGISDEYPFFENRVFQIPSPRCITCPTPVNEIDARHSPEHSLDSNILHSDQSTQYRKPAKYNEAHPDYSQQYNYWDTRRKDLFAFFLYRFIRDSHAYFFFSSRTTLDSSGAVIPFLNSYPSLR